MTIKCHRAHFTLDGKSLMNTARQLYWFEQKKEIGYNLLKESYEDIEDKHIISILNGDASLTSNNEFVDEIDVKFKKTIEEQKEFIRTHYYMIAGRYVDRTILSSYILDICKPLSYLAHNAFIHPLSFLNSPYESDHRRKLDFLIESRERKLKFLLESSGFDLRNTKGYSKFIREIDRLTDLFAGNIQEGSRGCSEGLTREEEFLIADIRGVKQTITISCDGKLLPPHDKTGKYKVAFSNHDQYTDNEVDLAPSPSDFPPEYLLPELMNEYEPGDSIASPMGNGRDFFKEFADILHTITELQIKKFNGEITEEEYLNQTTPLCHEKILEFIKAVMKHGIPITKPYTTLFNNLVNELQKVQISMSNGTLCECQIRAVLLFERIRGMIHVSDEISMKLLHEFPITDDIQKDRKFLIEFHNMMNESTEKAKEMLEEYAGLRS